MWGANAINGVVNVRTKPAEKTAGLLALAGGGNEDGFGAVRWGGKLGGTAAYRVYAKYSDRDAGAAQPGDPPAFDGWRDWRGGFRMDAGGLTVSGEYFGARNHYTFYEDTTTAPYLDIYRETGSNDGQSVTVRWSRGTLQAQAFIERVAQATSVARDERLTGDVDLQQTFAFGTWNALTVGGGLRFHHDDWTNGTILLMTPQDRDDLILNGYLQDEGRFLSDRLRVSLGVKLERNDVTGVEVQPSARAVLLPLSDHTIWVGAARAIRTPARVETDGRASVGIFLDGGGARKIVVIGDKDLDSETLIAIEAGHRFQWKKRVSIDTAIFHNEYDGIITGDTSLDKLVFFDEGGVSYVGIPFGNVDHGVIYGGEVSAKVNVNERFAISGAWSHLYPDLPSELNATATPRDFWNLRLYMNVTENAEWNIVYYSYEPSGFYDEQRLRGNDLTIPAFARLDMGLTLRFWNRYEVALWGQNLMEERHIEVKEGYINPPTEVERSFYGRLSTRW